MCARVIDIEIIIMLVSTDNCLITTKAEKMRSKVVDHIQQCFPLTTKTGNSLDYLNYRITQCSSFMTINQTPFIM